MVKLTRRIESALTDQSNGAYKAFYVFAGKKASEIYLKYTSNTFSSPHSSSRKSLGEYFSEEAKSVQQKANSEEKYLIDLFVRFGQVDSSLDILKSVPVYLKSFPKSSSFTKAGITESKYIIYHIGNYLQEIYILIQKMERLLKFISKKFRKTGRVQQSQKIEKCLELFKNEFMSLMTIRGRHVHETRYLNEDLHTLILLEFVRETHKALEMAYKRFVSQTRLKMLNWISEKNEELFSMLDNVFEVVNSYVLEP